MSQQDKKAALVKSQESLAANSIEDGKKRMMLKKLYYGHSGGARYHDYKKVLKYHAKL